MNRRAILLGAGALLSGCGFHPLYGPLSATGTAVAPELASVFVAVMPERQGQLLRQALQRRLEGTDSSASKLYELTGGLNISIEALGIQQDTSASRIRVSGSSDWVLSTLSAKPAVLTHGTARALDGYNVNNQQYFAADLEQSAAIGRLAEEIANQITLDLAIFFRDRSRARPTPA